MANETGSLDTIDTGATVVITHRVRDGKQDKYDEWLDEIAPICRSSQGLLDWHIIRQIPGITTKYTIIIRFDTQEHLQNWMESPERKRLIEKVRPILVKDDDFFVSSGLDFWFTPEGAKAKVPLRWKQFIILTYSVLQARLLC